MVRTKTSSLFPPGGSSTISSTEIKVGAGVGVLTESETSLMKVSTSERAKEIEIVRGSSVGRNITQSCQGSAAPAEAPTASGDGDASTDNTSNTLENNGSSMSMTPTIDDILNIPDPPTPQDEINLVSNKKATALVLERSRRNRRNSRRMSSSSLLPTPQKEPGAAATSIKRRNSTSVFAAHLSRQDGRGVGDADGTRQFVFSSLKKEIDNEKKEENDDMTVSLHFTRKQQDEFLKDVDGGTNENENENKNAVHLNENPNDNDSDDSNMDWEESYDEENEDAAATNHKHIDQTKQDTIAKPSKISSTSNTSTTTIVMDETNLDQNQNQKPDSIKQPKKGKNEDENKDEFDFIPTKGSIFLDDSSDDDSNDLNNKRNGKHHNDSKKQKHDPHRMNKKNRRSTILPPLPSKQNKKRRTSFMFPKGDFTGSGFAVGGILSSTSSSPSSKKKENIDDNDQKEVTSPSTNSFVRKKNKKRSRPSIILSGDNINQEKEDGIEEEQGRKFHWNDNDDNDDGNELNTPKQRKRKEYRCSMLIPNKNDLPFMDDSINNNDTSEQRKPKRRKARLSMEIPNEFHIRNDNDDNRTKNNKMSSSINKSKNEKSSQVVDAKKSNNQNIITSNEIKSISNSSSTSLGRQQKKVCTETLKKVKESIRKFCSLPLEKRYQSDDAIIVEQLSGYPLINAMEKARRYREQQSAINSNGHFSSHNTQTSSVTDAQTQNKNEVLQPYKPTVQEEKEVERRLANNVRRGLVNQIGMLISIMEAQKKQDTEIMEAGTGCRVEKRKGGKFKYVDLTSGKRVSANEYERRYLSTLEQRRIAREEEEKKNSVAIIEEASTSDESLPATEEEQNSFSCKDKINHCSSKPLITSKSCDQQKECSVTQNSVQTSESNNDPLESIEIPSRDEISGDPEIAAAQNILFDAIDTALRKYSDRIFEIRAMRDQERKALKNS